MRKAGRLVGPFAIAVAIAATVTAPALAQVARDPAAAGSAFARGRDAMRRGDLDAACELFAESVRLDPAPGARLNLADCEEKRGRYASARQVFADALEALPQGDDRIPFARERVSRLGALVATLVLSLPEGAPADAIVSRNGATVSARSLGAPIPVDPGEQEVTVEARGRRRSVVRVSVASGERRAITLAVGEPAIEPTTSSSPAPSSSPRSRALEWSLVGSGGALLVAGTILGIMTLDRASTVDAHCLPGCDAVGYSAAKEGQWMSITSPILIVAGAALAGTGIVMLLGRQNTAAAWK